MFPLVVGTAAGYVLGTKAGRQRYEQIKKGYSATVNSPVTKKVVDAGRRALANKLDPEPRMKEVKNLRKDIKRDQAADGTTILEPDND